MVTEHTNLDGKLQKRSKIPLVVGFVLALIGGSIGFYATWSGMILSGEHHANSDIREEKLESLTKNITFVEIEPMTISINARPNKRLLRFRAQLEVPNNYEDEVVKLLPRVVDVLNGYLRAVEISDLEDQSSLLRLKSQMLRRVQIVTGPNRISNFLIMEFVLT